jgi:hypothetical protein
LFYEGDEGIKVMKWKPFLLLWLVVFLFAPSILIHRLFMYQTPPPGSNLPGPPLFIPFGGIQYALSSFGQLVRGDFIDALMIFIFLILPILIYTFIVSLVLFHLGRYILRKIQNKKESGILTAP